MKKTFLLIAAVCIQATALFSQSNPLDKKLDKVYALADKEIQAVGLNDFFFCSFSFTNIPQINNNTANGRVMHHIFNNPFQPNVIPIFMPYPYSKFNGFAWVGHFFIEKNKPATFTYPLYSLGSDFVMFWHILTGQIGKKLEEAKKTIG